MICLKSGGQSRKPVKNKSNHIYSHLIAGELATQNNPIRAVTVLV